MSTGLNNLPQDAGAEAAVLGSMIVGPVCIDAVAKLMDHDAFLREEHRLIFDAVMGLFRANGAKGVDGLLVKVELERRGQLKAIGGPDYLQQVMDKVPSAASVNFYADIVLDRHRRRQAIVIGQRLTTNGCDLMRNIGEQLREAREDLEGIRNPINGSWLPTTCAADITPQKPTFHLDNILVDFGINIIQGDGGVGKSRLSHSLAAKTSTGEALMGTNLRPRKGSVRIFSIEDPKEFIVDNLQANGADLKSIHIVSEIFDIRDAASELDDWQSEHPDCRLWILDSLPSYLGDSNANSNSEVRAALTPLAELAAKWRVAILGINHLNKRADLAYIHRGLGSTAFTALARSVWAVILDKDDPDLRIFAPVKCNYSIKPTGLRYRIIDGVVAFESAPWTGRLDDEMKPRDNKLRVEQCADWLRDRLRSGAVLSTTVFTEASDMGFSRDLCYRAKERLSLHASKAGFDRGWFWHLGDDGNGEESKNGM